jgi:hypothetical protein
MGQDQDPYDDSGGFTPYQPSGTPASEADATPETPYVPYGGAPNVPYGSAYRSTGAAFVTSTPSKNRWVGWVVGIGVVLVTCGGGIGGIVGAFNGDGDNSSGSGPDITVPTIELPTFPSLVIPSIDIPTASVRTEIFANDLQRSQCLNGLGFDPSANDGISRLEVAECEGAHNAQVLEVRVLTAREAAAYDFKDSSQGDRSCFPLFSRTQKALFQGDKYTLLSFTETADPIEGDKVACLVVRTDGARIRGFLPQR